jgi:hypothetical protein
MHRWIYVKGWRGFSTPKDGTEDQTPTKWRWICEVDENSLRSCREAKQTTQHAVKSSWHAGSARRDKVSRSHRKRQGRSQGRREVGMFPGKGKAGEAMRKPLKRQVRRQGRREGEMLSERGRRGKL